MLFLKHNTSYYMMLIKTSKFKIKQWLQEMEKIEWVINKK